MKIDEILEAARLAPSGDNCQPWHLVVKNNQIDLYNVPERDHSFFNFRQKASLIAHGALLENLLIAASALGVEVDLKLFPDPKRPNLVATARLRESKPAREPLYACIFARGTNRKPYRLTSPDSGQMRALTELPVELAAGRVKLADETKDKRVLAEAVAASDRLILENRLIHRFLFDHVRWTDAEAERTKNGLHLKTLELDRVQAVFFKFLKNWHLTQILNLFGCSRIFARQTKRAYLLSVALGIITVNGSRDEDFVRGGRILERVWLEAARVGLSFQPMAGIACLMQRVLAGEAGGLPPQHMNRVLNAYNKIRQVFDLGDETIILLFRIGYSDPPSARSLRFPLEKVMQLEHLCSDQ